MKLYDVLALYPAPAGTPVEDRAVLYSNIACETDAAAIAVAKDRHMNNGLRMSGVEFRVAASRIVLCPTELPEAA